MKVKHLLFCGLLLSCLLPMSYAYTRNDNELFVDNLMQDYSNDETFVPGASVLVIHQNVTIIRRSYGFANIEAQTYATPRTNFRLASVTKQFTAAAILLLIQNNYRAIQLDDRIRERWFPELPEVTKAMTVRHLLTHTSGLIDYEDIIPPGTDPNYQLSDADVLKILSTENQTYFSPPGSKYLYSNSGYALLALIVERISGKTFANFLKDHIFLPSGMNETVAYEKDVSTVSNRAFGYSYRNQLWTRTDQSQTSAVLGDGGVYSSINDLEKWDAALYDNRLLNSEYLHLALTAAVRTDDPGTQYAMGWRVSGDMVWHSGETTGFRNVILRFPKQYLTVVILTNRNSPPPYQSALVIAHRMMSTMNDCKNSNSISLNYSIKLFISWTIMCLFYCNRLL
ncbi:unnamed protein product [Adineta ricciae]|uniref:Beta-lactamase-related domain-containing protein n=1 Tax=Adineta ricciae TaxID=249248 RepID=A0A813X219_ADIRI|nr:unnamed protein product [Adineta ricciae]